MSLEQTQRLRNAVADALLPPPALLVSQWAREKFILSSEYSATTGHFDPYPYQVEPLDVLSPSNPAETMVLMCGAQMTKTIIMQILLCYVVDVDPGPMLIVQPNAEDANSFSKERIAPMFRDIPAIAGKVVEAKSRDSGNTIWQKRFRGGQVSLTGAVSPRGLRRRSVRYLLLDEVDGYEDTSDGDPVALAAARASKFWNRKIVLCSTPTSAGRSRIAKAYEQSDQRKFFVPCPECSTMQVLRWPNVRWGQVGDRLIQPDEAHYECDECGALIPHHRKLEMLRGGEWRATNPEGKYPGFWIWRGYSPDCSWGKIVTDPLEGFLATKDDPIKFKVFVNNVLAELWTEPGEKLEWERLVERREPYGVGKIPMGGLFLTAGVDVQRADGGRLECEIVAWGENRESWSVDYRILYGNPAEREVWDRLEDLLHGSFPHESGGELVIERMYVDSSDGTTTRDVYDWVTRQPRPRVWAIKGDRRSDQPVSGPRSIEYNGKGQKTRYGTIFRLIDVDYFKSGFYADLRKRRPTDEERAAGLAYPQGYCHFPIDTVYGDEHFRQICAERLVSKPNKKGRMVHGYEQDRPRNEALDCRVYAMAAAWEFGVHKFDSEDWDELRNRLERSIKKQVEEVKPSAISRIPQQSQFRPTVFR